MNIDYKKIAEIMCWECPDGMSYEELFKLEVNNPAAVPNYRIIDVAHAGDIRAWARQQDCASERELIELIKKTMRIAINAPQFADKKTRDIFPPLYNFHLYCQRVDRSGKLNEEAEAIAEMAWNGVLAVKRLNERTAAMFAETPDPEKFQNAAAKIKKIWGFSDNEIEAFRYFVCQCRHEGHNPSMNKSLYLFSNTKRTGKTSIARALVAVLNGELSMDAAGAYESTLATEMQYNDHALPLCAQSNAVLLDEMLPKDSKKAYGQIKSMLTSNTCHFNPKYQRVVTLPAKRFYIFTSNDELSDFIQDDKERRFIPIFMERMPEQISFEEIYQIWKDFAQNCTPEPNWQVWYNSFAEVDGLLTKEKDYYKNAIKGDEVLLSIIKGLEGYFVGPPLFNNHLLVGKHTREERKAVLAAMHELFGEPYSPSRWKKSTVIEVLTRDDDTAFLTPEDISINSPEAKGLPF